MRCVVALVFIGAVASHHTAFGCVIDVAFEACCARNGTAFFAGGIANRAKVVPCAKTAGGRY